MQSSPSSDDRWQQVVSLHTEFEDNVVALPRLDGRDSEPRRPSPRAVEFAQALAFDDAWSGITEARERRARRRAA